MEKKDKIIRKIHLKDYTNALEKVLEKKNFSIETKNLLLSMFYKIENAYPDYLKMKSEVYDKGVLLENLINIVENKCNEIILKEFNIEDDSNENKLEEAKAYIIDKEKGKIISLGNEFTLLNAIIEINQDEICIPEEEGIFEKPITYFLNTGMKMHQAEIIRDFNGWSWEIIKKDITNIKVNVFFQTFLYLLGYEFINNWIQNESKLADYIILAYENLKINFGDERAKILIELFLKITVDSINNVDKNQAEFWKERQKETKNELEKLNNKSEYLEEMTKEKRKLNGKIERIDRILNNKEELEKEYKTRNENLPNKEKIFSIRHLISKLEIERQEYVNKIRICNKLIEPKGYVDRKEELEKRENFLDKLNIVLSNVPSFRRHSIEDDYLETLTILCLKFLECLQIKIGKSQTKQEIIQYFYILRYYGFLPYNDDGESLKQLEPLKEKFEKVTELLIEKAQKLNAIENITDDMRINNEIIKKLFNSRMIDLNHIVVETKVSNGKLVIEYYDTNILENTYEIECNRTIKLKKKTKLFV